MGNLVDYRTDRGVAVLTLNDPPVNSYTLEMLSDLGEAVTNARYDDDVHVLVITGHGEHCFSAGANISMLREVDPKFRCNFFLTASEVLARLERTSKLVIAALNGHAVGGGLEIALACDIRIARRYTGTIGFPEIDLGILPGAGGTQRLARIVGKARAMQMTLECEKISFEKALEYGLVHYVWEAETHQDFIDLVLNYARKFTPPNKAVLAVGGLKRAIQSVFDMPMDASIAFERELLAQLIGSDDAIEGMNAWHEKRPPSFQGK